MLRIWACEGPGGVGGASGSPPKHCGRHLCAGAGSPAGGGAVRRREPPGRPERTHTLTTPPARGPLARIPRPARVPPPAALQGGVSSSAHCSRPSARPAPPRPAPLQPPARSWGRRRGRGPARTGRESPQPPAGPSRADTARAAATRRSSADWRRASAQLCRSGREEGPPERDSGTPGHRPAAGATARPP